MQKRFIITAVIRLAGVGSPGKPSRFAASKFGVPIIRGLTSESDSVDSFSQNSRNESDSNNDQPGNVSGKSASSKLRSTIDEGTNTYLEMYPHMRQVSENFKRKPNEEKKPNSNRQD